MREVKSEEARRTFRDLLDEAERGGVIGILRYDRPAAIMVPPDWYARDMALRKAVLAFTHDTDGHWLPGESELPVGELLRLIGEAALKDLEANDASEHPNAGGNQKP